MPPPRVINPQVICPLDPKHGIQGATPNGFRGIRLACGCEIIALENNSGWAEKQEFLARRVEVSATPFIHAN